MINKNTLCIITVLVLNNVANAMDDTSISKSISTANKTIPMDTVDQEVSAILASMGEKAVQLNAPETKKNKKRSYCPRPTSNYYKLRTAIIRITSCY